LKEIKSGKNKESKIIYLSKNSLIK